MNLYDTCSYFRNPVKMKNSVFVVNKLLKKKLKPARKKYPWELINKLIKDELINRIHPHCD